MNYVFDVPEIPSVNISGTSDLFPVHRIYCVGQNYVKHAREMGINVDRISPFFFSKPSDSVIPLATQVPFPLATENLQHEIELVVAIGKKGIEIQESEALEHVYGYAVGIDLTRRDLQIEAKMKSQPWTTAKGFDKSAPCSSIHLVSKDGYLDKGKITLSVNDEIRQKGDISEMIWSVKEIISFLSSFFELFPGDLIFTGTPRGVGQLKRGDKVEGEIENLEKFIFKII